MGYVARMTIPIAITSLCATITTAAYFYRNASLAFLSKTINDLTVVIVAFTFIVGSANYVLYQASLLRRKRDTWWLSLIGIAVFFLMAVPGVLLTPANPIYIELFTDIYAPGEATLFAICFLWMLSATYRAFRVKSVDGTLLLVAAFVTMLTNAPIGEMLLPGISTFGAWLMNWPNIAGQRAVIIGSALGAIGMILRIIIGREKSHFGGLL